MAKEDALEWLQRRPEDLPYRPFMSVSDFRSMVEVIYDDLDSVSSNVDSVATLDLPASSLSTGSVLAFSPARPRIVADSAAEQAWVAEAPDNVATVTVSFVYGEDSVLSTSHDITVAPAEYSSAMTAAVYGTTSDPAGVVFGTDGTRCTVELDPEVYPSTQGMSLSVSGPAANAMGFTDGQESEVLPGQWLVVQDSDLPSTSSLLERIEALEQGGGGGGAALSSVRRRRSAYWYAAGPPGSVGTLVPVLGTAYALRMPGMAAGNIIDAVSVEISTALTAGNSGVVDFYIAAPHTAYEYPGVLGARLVSYTFTSSDAVGRPTIDATTSYVCPEDGDYWIIMVLRSGTAPTLRALQQNTTVGFGTDSPGTPGVSTVGSPGYRDTAFPEDASIEGGVTGWTSSVNPASAAPRLYWRMG